MLLVLVVAAGSALGGVLRYLVSGALQLRTNSTFPVGTLAVNVVGCFVLGALVRYAALHPALSPAWRLFIGAGLCGGLTTFSTFSMETVALVQEGRAAQAGVYVAMSLLLGLGAALAGAASIRGVTS